MQCCVDACIYISAAISREVRLFAATTTRARTRSRRQTTSYQVNSSTLSLTTALLNYLLTSVMTCDVWLKEPCVRSSV